uniref:Type III potassium channel toxin protein n=1 Tax=Anemonia sulcata TaxID=6108 RepID=A0A0S1M196_ANESU|nr:type III potassium channel toxin protein [Anemonia sulcata]
MSTARFLFLAMLAILIATSLALPLDNDEANLSKRGVACNCNGKQGVYWFLHLKTCPKGYHDGCPHVGGRCCMKS